MPDKKGNDMLTKQLKAARVARVARLADVPADVALAYLEAEEWSEADAVRDVHCERRAGYTIAHGHSDTYRDSNEE